MKVRPQYTINPIMMEIWPLDGWSRKIIIDALVENEIRYTFVFTTMGEPALKFLDSKDYESAYMIISHIEF